MECNRRGMEGSSVAEAWWLTPSPPRCARHLSPSSGERRGARHRCCALWRPLCPAGISCFPPLLRSRRVSSSPRPVFTVWLLVQMGSGARGPHLSVCFIGANHAPAGVFAADGVGRIRPWGSSPHLLRGSETLRPYRPDRHRGPGLGWDRPTKPRHRSATNPAPPPSPTPRSGAGFPRGRWGHYAGGGGAWDKSRRRKMRK